MEDDPRLSRLYNGFYLQGGPINHHLYFLTPSLTPDESRLVFASYRTGRCEFFTRGFPEGETVQLTNEEDVHGYSGLITRDGRSLLYTASGAVRAVDLASREVRTLGEFPGGQLGECSLSADGRWIVTAIKRAGRSGLAVTAAERPLKIDRSRSYVEVDVKSTLKNFTAHLDTYEVRVSVDDAGKIKGAVLQFKFSDLRTGDDKRNALFEIGEPVVVE